jgi:hypothetical protein
MDCLFASAMPPQCYRLMDVTKLASDAPSAVRGLSCINVQCACVLNCFLTIACTLTLTLPLRVLGSPSSLQVRVMNMSLSLLWCVLGQVLIIIPTHLPRPRPLDTPSLPHRSPHTPRVHHTPIRPHPNRAATESLMTDCTVSVFIHNYSSIQPTWFPRLFLILVAQA